MSSLSSLSSLSSSQEKDLINMTKGLFMILLTVSGGFTVDTLGCQSQYLFSNNMLVKQIIIFSMIYFTIDLTTTEHPHPMNILKKAVCVWVFFIMFTKMNKIFTSVSFVFILSIFVLQKYKAYLNEQKDETKDENIMKIQTYGVVGLLTLVIIGFSVYYFEKKQEYGDSFDFSTFMFGRNTCKSFH